MFSEFAINETEIVIAELGIKRLGLMGKQQLSSSTSSSTTNHSLNRSTLSTVYYFPSCLLGQGQRQRQERLLLQIHPQRLAARIQTRILQPLLLISNLSLPSTLTLTLLLLATVTTMNSTTTSSIEDLNSQGTSPTPPPPPVLLNLHPIESKQSP